MADIAVTITAVEYVEKIQIEETTLLGETYTAEREIDKIVATIDCGALTGHAHNFPPEAVGNRMVVYAADERGAVEALVREVIFAWSPGLLPASDSAADANGGADPRIAVEWSQDAAAALPAVLAPLVDRIDAARARFSPDEPAPAAPTFSLYLSAARA